MTDAEGEEDKPELAFSALWLEHHPEALVLAQVDPSALRRAASLGGTRTHALQ
jgi:hypothetical protein